MLNGDISNKQAPILAIDAECLLVEKDLNILQKFFKKTRAYEVDKLKVKKINRVWSNFSYSIYIIVKWNCPLSEIEIMNLLGENNLYYTRTQYISNMQELNSECSFQFSYYFVDSNTKDIPLLNNVRDFEDITKLF